MPRSVNLILTTRCNLRCRYCYLGQNGRRARLSQPGRLLDAVFDGETGDRLVTFTGGEPLLSLDAVRRVLARFESAATQAPHMRWQLVTNGLLLDPRASRFLEAHDVAVSLSFDGVRGAQALRGGHTFAILDARLDWLRREQPEFFTSRFGVRLTLAPAAVRYFGRSIEYLLRKEVRRITVTPALGCSDWRTGAIAALRTQFGRACTASRRHYEAFGRVPLDLLRNGFWDLGAYGGRWTCGAPSGREIAIDVDGRAYACSLAAPSHQRDTAPALRSAVEALALGRPGTPEYAERLATLAARARASGAFDHPELRYSSYRRCADCRYLPRCSACPLAAAHDPTYTDIRRVPDFVCAFTQAALEACDRFWSR